MPFVGVHAIAAGKYHVLGENYSLHVVSYVIPESS